MKIKILNEELLPKDITLDDKAYIEVSPSYGSAIKDTELYSQNMNNVIAKLKRKVTDIVEEDPKIDDISKMNKYTEKSEKIQLDESLFEDVKTNLTDRYDWANQLADELDDFIRSTFTYTELRKYGLESLPIARDELYDFSENKPELDESLNEARKDLPPVNPATVDDEKFEYFVYTLDDQKRMHKIARELVNAFDGLAASRKGYAPVYIAPNYAVAKDALDYVVKAHDDLRFAIGEVEKKEKPKYVYDLDEDIFTRVYDSLTRTSKNKKVTAGYDYSHSLATDINGNLLVYGHTLEDLKPAIDIAEKFIDEDVTYDVDPFATGKSYLAHVVRINIPDVPMQELPDNRFDKAKKLDQI